MRGDTLFDTRDARRVHQIAAGDLDQAAEQRRPGEQIVQRLQPAPQLRIAIGEGGKFRFRQGRRRATQATCGVGSSVSAPPIRQEASANAKTAIYTQRPSISSPARLSRSTALTASAADNPSSAPRRAASAASASVRKCPLPQHGSSTVISAARPGQPGKVPAAGRQRPYSRTNRR